MMRNRHNRRRPLADINIVPYVDVMLVLLVIFMITAPLLTQGIQVKLPQTAAKTLPPQKDMPIIVSVDQRGALFLNSGNRPAQSLTPQQLMSQISAELTASKKVHKIRDFYVKGDRDANYGAVVRAMVLLQKAGVKDVGLITKPTKNAI